jgi:uncharacterized repeat protein (TIGR01451 family)
MEPMERRVLLAQTFTVTNTLDDGSVGSLRWAIGQVNADAGAGTDTIAFDIPGPGVHTIAVGSELPTVLHPVVIDGYTQPGSSPNDLAVGDDAVLAIELDGSAAGGTAGLTLRGPNSVVRGLVINRFSSDAIDAGGNGAVITGNFIGTDPTGTIPRGNGHAGVFTSGSVGDRIGGTSPADRNILSANDIGLQIYFGGDALIQGNYIGVDATGMHPLGNHGSDGLGIYFTSSTGNTVGGTAAGAGNVISGNTASGVHALLSPNDLIEGNFIGTDATGMAAIGNGAAGVLINNSANDTVRGNLLSGNVRAGVDMIFEQTTGTVVVGNKIGTDILGNPVLGNTNYGVLVRSSGNQIGGIGPGQGNLIAGNGKGVVVNNNLSATDPVGNSILGNAIYANATLGIDLGNDGPTPNHPTSPTPGPNHFQNYPVLASVGGNTVAGTLDSTPFHTYRLEFFESPQPGPGGFAQGQVFLGSTDVITDGTGKASFTATLPVAINPGLAVTATATDTTSNSKPRAVATFGDTSEFSVPSADLAVTKVADPVVGTAGQPLTYTLTVTNDGPFQATGVIATDAVPAGAVFVAASASQGTTDLVGGAVVARLGGLAAGASATVTIVVTPSRAGSLTNAADVAANEPDPNPDNNSDTVTTTINPAPPPPPVDLAVSKSAPAAGVTGQDLSYTIAVSNAGPGDEPAAHLVDLLPPGVTFVSASEPPAVVTPGRLEFDLGDLPAGASRTIALLVRPTAAGTLVNQAVVSGVRRDRDPTNNAASATTTVTAAPAALAVSLVADPSTGTVGHELTYTLTVSNSGPGPASGVVLTSALPAGATIVAASQTQGTSAISNGVVTTALGGLAVGASATVTIVVIPTAAGTLTTVARVAGNEPNPNPDGAVATLSTPVASGPPTPSADLLVTKTASPNPATVGVPLSYTVTVTNLGPDAEPAAGATLVDLLPPGVAFVSSSLAPVSSTPNSLTYALGGLAAGASQSVTIVVMPKVPGVLVNQAVATGIGPDPNPSNNYAEVSVAAHQAPTVVSLQRLGYHAGPTTLALRFSAPLDVATATDVRNYQLFQVLRDGRRAAIPIRSAAYDPAGRTVTLTPARQLYLFARYQLVVNGTGPTGVSDVYGNLLDGAGTGRPGSNYVRVFGQEVLVGQSPPRGPHGHASARATHGFHPARAVVAAGWPGQLVEGAR